MKLLNRDFLYRCRLMQKIMGISFVISLILITGCKTRQKATLINPAPIQIKANSNLFSDILDNEVRYEKLSSKLNLNISLGTKSISSRASFKLIKNKALQLSIQPLFGVEMFRVYIDRDSIVILDRMSKEFVKESIEDLQKRYPVGFNYFTIQALFENSIFVANKTSISQSDYTLFDCSKSSDMFYKLQAKDYKSGIDYSFLVNSNDKISFTNISDDVGRYSIQWSYSEFSVIDSEQIFPHSMFLTASAGNRKMDIEMSFMDIKTDQEFNLDLNIPKSYTKTSIQSIIKIISQL